MHAVFTVLHSMPAYLHGKAHFKLNASKVAGLSARVMQPPAHFLLSGSSVLGKMGTPPHHLISLQCFITAQRHTFSKFWTKLAILVVSFWLWEESKINFKINFGVNILLITQRLSAIFNIFSLRSYKNSNLRQIRSK